MAFVGLDSSATVRWVHPKDPDPENPTVWILGTISTRVQAVIKDKAANLGMEFSAAGESQGMHAAITPNQLAVETVRVGLRGWENYPDPTGKQIPFTAESDQIAGLKVLVVSEECLNRIPIDLIRDLQAEIEKRNEATEDEGKDSGE